MGRIVASVSLGLALLAVLGLLLLRQAEGLVGDYAVCLAKSVEHRGPAGMTVEAIAFDRPTLDWAGRTLHTTNLSARLRFPPGFEFLADRAFTLTMAALDLRLDSLLTGQATVGVQGLNLVAVDEAGTGAPHGNPASSGVTALSDGRATIPLALPLGSPTALHRQLAETAQGLLRVAQGEDTPIPLAFSAIAEFRINADRVKCQLTSQRREGRTRLTTDTASIQVISLFLNEKLTAPEVELLALYPLKAPRLLQIRDDAQGTAKDMHRADPTVPEDAYRHVLWSYLLTQAYGPAFAQQVTDAHEQGVTDNTEAEHRMDYQNNAVGRKYAAKGYRREEILGRLGHDPEVIREAGL